ncbi:MAG: hypothetical protein ABUL62_04920 [Myxococcales bacterium]
MRDFSDPRKLIAGALAAALLLGACSSSDAPTPAAGAGASSVGGAAHAGSGAGGSSAVAGAPAGAGAGAGGTINAAGAGFAAGAGGASVGAGAGGFVSGAAGTGTSAGAAGTNGGAGTGAAGAGPVGACGPTTPNQHPFGCQFAWGGAADDQSSLASFSYLQFMSYWIDSTISASGTYTTCNGCTWLTSKVKSTALIPAYYAYIIGFLAHANGIVDGNQTGGKKLTTDGAALVKANRAAIVSAYGWYAKETYKVWPTKPLVWLLEGDFVQLQDAGQSSPMTMAEVGQLAADITCAIKANMPNAVVAIDQSSWNSDDITNSYWGAMKNANYDLVWTTGVGNNKGYLEAAANDTYYNHATATYAYLKKLTGRSILVDTSAGASAAGDSWSSTSVADINSRIAEGVIGVNITGTSPAAGNITKFSSVNALPSCQ